jgi:hypothetical protein
MEGSTIADSCPGDCKVSDFGPVRQRALEVFRLQAWIQVLTWREDDPGDTAAEKFHHNVYVILLDPKVARHPAILRLNPKGGSGEAVRLCPASFPEAAHYESIYQQPTLQAVA